MAKYTDQEKMDAVSFLVNLKKEGTVSIDDFTQVSNVRDLCKNLGISSYSLYKWAKAYDVDIAKTQLTISENPERSMELIYDETIEVIDEIAEQNGFVDDNRIIVQSEIRFFGNLAGMLKVKGYSSMPLKQLQLAIGLKLVQRSGLGGK